MHDTAYETARLFFGLYWQPEFRTVIELGSQNVNGTLRDHCPPEAHYVGLDLEPGAGVDLVVAAGQPLPLADASVDVVVTSSAFEHDICFWQTFLELVRVVRPGGLVYVNAPSNHHFHRYPVDCWRFYPDAGLALASWARRNGMAVELVECFVGRPGDHGWADFVAVFRRTGDLPLRRAGRIARHVEALNIYDIETPEGLEAESAENWDDRRAAALKARLQQCESELEAARDEITRLATRIDALVQVAEETAAAAAEQAARPAPVVSLIARARRWMSRG